MNSKTTLALILMTGVAGVWLWKGDEWGPRIGLKPAHPEPPPSAAAAVLDSLQPGGLSHIEVALSPDDKVELDRTDSGWRLPGNWPPRRQEIEELVNVLGNLRTRFAAIPIGEGTDLVHYGLAESQSPLIVRIVANNQPVTLTFGNPEPDAGDTNFTRPAYVKVNDIAEILPLGPDVVRVLKRPSNAYRRRQLFTDVERVKLAAGSVLPSPAGQPAAESAVTINLPGAETEWVKITTPPVRLLGAPIPELGGSFTLTRTGKLPEPGVVNRGEEPATPTDRLAEAWAITSPVRDHAEPARLKGVLEGVGELWVDTFLSAAELDASANLRRCGCLLAGAAPGGGISAAVAAAAPLPLDIRREIDRSQHAVTVKLRNGAPVTVRFGGIARTAEIEVTDPQPPMIPGAPPMPSTRKIAVPYRYARVDGNPQVFVVRADKYNAMFTTTSRLKDPQVARFSSDEVWEAAIRRAGSPDLKLIRKKGNPRAIDPADRQERWLIDAAPNPLPGDAAKIRDLLDQLAGFRADNPDHLAYPAAAPAAETTVAVTAREKRAEGEPDAPSRTIVLEIGKPDIFKRLISVQVQGWPRVTQVSDRLGPDDLDSWLGGVFFPKTISALLTRPPIAYRGRKLFDTSDATLTSVAVTASSGGFTLSKDGNDWKLTVPVQSEADPGKAAQLATSLSSLEATEYLADKPSAEEMANFGLDKPRVVMLGFTGGRNYKLEIGAARTGKPEMFARLDGGAVFGLPASINEQLTTGVLGLLPLRVWAAAPEKVTGLEVTRMGDAAKQSFTLALDGTNFKLSGPFNAPVPFLNAQPLLTTLGALSAVKYQAMTVANKADYGLDKPQLQLKLSYKEKKPAPAGTDAGEATITKTLVVGGPSPDGNRYAMLVDAPNAPVLVVPAAFVAAAQVAPLDLLDRALLYLDSTRIARIRVAPEKAADAFTVARGDAGKWAVEGAPFAVDAPRIARLVGTVGALPIVRLVDYGDGDAVKWADYGLDHPTTITVTLSGDKPATHAIALGKADSLGGRFVRVDDGKAVGVVAPEAVATLLGQKFDYADHALLSFDPNSLLGFSRKKGAEELELAPAAAVGWDELKPNKLKADQVLMEELADALGKLRADRVVAYGKRDDVYKPYGLEAPRVSISLTVGDKAEQKVLRLGNPVDPARPEGECFAAVESSAPETIVGVIPGPLASRLLAGEIAFRDHTLSKFVDADKAVLERGDRTITFAKVGAAWQVTAPLMAQAEAAELEALVADLGKLRVDTWVAPKAGDLAPYGLDKPQAKWMLSDGGKPVLTLLLGKRQADGRVHVATDKSELVGLLDPIASAKATAEYRKRRPWDLDAAQAEAIDVVRGEARFSLQKSGPAWFDPAKPEPIDIRAVNELLGTLGGLKVERYMVDKDADLKLYGLTTPEASIVVASQGGQRKVLEIGAAVGGTDGKQRYARVADPTRTDVFVLSAADTARLLRERAAYLLKK